ncbi:unnamed protein product [Nezara viridula]|uniref:PIN domain-containing protein n=1 Tax=Nezara viridula TaxID=85310 RepID=A0A9P0MUF8_NEZVI|nr:unnamed protein product [Nezara viridula]
MGNSKQARKFAKQRFAQMKKMISEKDPRVVQKRLEKNPKLKHQLEQKKKKEELRNVPQYSSALFFQYNTQLGPPFHVIIDTNFVNFSIKYKMDIIQSMMDCLYGKCIPYITDCVLAEMEKLGRKYRIALRIMKDPRYERLPCMHKGTYADDCIAQRVTQVRTGTLFMKSKIYPSIIIKSVNTLPVVMVPLFRYSSQLGPGLFRILPILRSF